VFICSSHSSDSSRNWKKGIQQILRLLRFNLFGKRDLMALLRGDSLHDEKSDIKQMALL
jgi:hypothetical protein